MRTAFLGVLAAGMVMAGSAAAQDFTPAIIFDMGGKFDKSFNEAAYTGAERFKEETGIEYLEFEVTNESQRDQALRRMARRGADVVVAVGFSFADAARDRSPRSSPRPSSRSSMRWSSSPTCSRSCSRSTRARSWSAWRRRSRPKTGKVGFVGGMDIPLIRNFAHGYEQGVNHVDPRRRGVTST